MAKVSTEVIASVKATASFLIALIAPMFLVTATVNAAPAKTTKGACALAKSLVAAKGHFPPSVIAFCDVVPAASSPTGYYVLALHSKRPDCNGICSTNMGWFAVEKTSGRLFEWDVAEQKLGPLISAGL